MIFYADIIKDIWGKDVDVSEVINIIKSDSKLKTICDNLKNLLPKENDTEEQIIDLKKQRNKIKTEQLPYVVWQGTFKPRNLNGLQKASGLACIDIDEYDMQTSEELKESLKKDEYVHIAFISPSGGLKVIIKIPEVKNDEEYKKYYGGICNHFDIELDMSTIDISRACFLAYDENVYVNNESKVFTQQSDLIAFSNISKPKKTPDEKNDGTLDRSKKEFGQVIESIYKHMDESSSLEDLKFRVFKDMVLFDKWTHAPMQYRDRTFSKAVLKLLQEWENEVTKQLYSNKNFILKESIIKLENIKKNTFTNTFTKSSSVEKCILTWYNRMVFSDTSVVNSISGLSANLGIIPTNSEQISVYLKNNLNFEEKSDKRVKKVVKLVKLVKLSFFEFFPSANIFNKKSNELYYSIYILLLLKFCLIYDFDFTTFTTFTNLTNITTFTNEKNKKNFIFPFLGLEYQTPDDILIYFERLNMQYSRGWIAHSIMRERDNKVSGLLFDGIFEKITENNKTLYCTSIKGLREASEQLMLIMKEDLDKEIEFLSKKTDEVKQEATLDKVRDFVKTHHAHVKILTYRGERSEVHFDYKIFAQELPELAKDFLTDADGVREVIKSSISQHVLKGKDRNKINIIIKNLPQKTCIPIGELNDSFIDKPLKLFGRVVMASANRVEASSVTFECPKCSHTLTIEQTREDQDIKKPSICVAPGCGYKGAFREIDSQLRTFQTIKLQERTEDMADRSSTRDITIYLYDGLTSKKNQHMFNPGTDIMIDGVLKKIHLKKNNIKQKEVTLYIEAMDCLTDTEKKDFIVTKGDKEKCIALKEKHGDAVLDIVCDNISKDIIGMSSIKKAIACCLANTGLNESILTHVLLVGDPSVGKSKTCIDALPLVQTNAIISGASSTGVGMTASVEKDEFTGQWGIKAGAIPLANGGVALLDELEKQENTDVLLEPMEHQRIHVSKASVNAEIKTCTGILATANPKYGRFQDGKKIIEQLKISYFLMSRFDLIFAIKTDPTQHSLILKKMISEFTNSVNDKTKEEIQKPNHLDDNFLRKYFAYIRTIKPQMSEEMQKLMYTIQTSLFSDYKNVDPRMMRSVFKVAYAIARLRQHVEITKEDIVDAVKLKRESLDSYLVEKDIDEMTIGVTNSERNLLIMIPSFILKSKTQELSRDQIQALLDKKITNEQYDTALKKLLKVGDIIEVRKNTFKVNKK